MLTKELLKLLKILLAWIDSDWDSTVCCSYLPVMKMALKEEKIGKNRDKVELSLGSLDEIDQAAETDND